MIKWHKEVRKIGTELAMIDVWLSSEMKKSLETDLRKDIIKRTRSTGINNLSPSTNISAQKESKKEEGKDLETYLSEEIIRYDTIRKEVKKKLRKPSEISIQREKIRL
jgi:hypothetical protein